jgi:malate dehydrogenase
LDKRIQDAGTEVVNAKGGAGSATLSMAYAASKFLDYVLKGLLGEKSVACAYIGGQGAECEFLAGPVEFDKSGAAKLLPIPVNITEYEKKRIAEAKSKLVGDIKAGIDFIKNPPVAPAGAQAPAPAAGTQVVSPAVSPVPAAVGSTGKFSKKVFQTFF